MNETDFRSLLMVYQQKCGDMLSQVIALEAKMLVANQKIEFLTKENEALKVEGTKTRKKTTTKTVIDSEEF